MVSPKRALRTIYVKQIALPRLIEGKLVKDEAYVRRVLANFQKVEGNGRKFGHLTSRTEQQHGVFNAAVSNGRS